MRTSERRCILAPAGEAPGSRPRERRVPGASPAGPGKRKSRGICRHFSVRFSTKFMGFAEVFAVCAVVAILAMYLKNMQQDVQFVRSRVDGKEYLVLKMPDSAAAADCLARLNAGVRTLIAAMEREAGAEEEDAGADDADDADDADEEDEDEASGADGKTGGADGKKIRVDRAKVLRNIKRRYKRTALSEGGTDTSVTSYSQGKGERIVMCLRERDAKGKLGALEDGNTLMYVLLHEVGHLATDEIGHVPIFWANFRYILDVAAREGIYEKIDYSANNQAYCGIEITSSASFPRGGSHGTTR